MYYNTNYGIIVYQYIKLQYNIIGIIISQLLGLLGFMYYIIHWDIHFIGFIGFIFSCLDLLGLS